MDSTIYKKKILTVYRMVKYFDYDHETVLHTCNFLNDKIYDLSKVNLDLYRYLLNINIF